MVAIDFTQIDGLITRLAGKGVIVKPLFQKKDVFHQAAIGIVIQFIVLIHGVIVEITVYEKTFVFFGGVPQ